MADKILVCTSCCVAVPLNSVSNTAPRWTGEVGDPIGSRQEIEDQDDLRDFRAAHKKEAGHNVIEAVLG